MESRNLAWVEVKLGAIEANLARIQEAVQCPVLAMVKANGYGHGAAAIARTAVAAGARMLGVATVSEGLELRESGIVADILIMGRVTLEETPEALRSGLQWTVWTEAQVAEASDVAARLGVHAKLHFEVDIGMSRFGADPEDVPRLLEASRGKPSVEIVGLAAHFPSSDISDPGPTLAQNKILQELILRLESRHLRPKLVHAANSAAAVRFCETRYDMVRIGIMLYGESPFDDAQAAVELVPALTWKTRLLDVKTLRAGSGVGYGGEYVSAKGQTIGVIGIGYSYGFRRVPKNCNEVLIRGRRVAVIGRVCMQQCMINLDEVPAASVGDEVVLLGQQGHEEISTSEVAERWQTNRWDVLSGISLLLPRKYDS